MASDSIDVKFSFDMPVHSLAVIKAGGTRGERMMESLLSAAKTAITNAVLAVPDTVQISNDASELEPLLFEDVVVVPYRNPEGRGLLGEGSIHIAPSATLGELMQMIEGETRIPHAVQRLSFRGRIICDGIEDPRSARQVTELENVRSHMVTVHRKV